MVISSRQKLQSLNDKTININYNANDIKINQTIHSKALGLSTDENLTWKEHIRAIQKRIASCIGALKRVLLDLLRSFDYLKRSFWRRSFSME